MSAAKFENRLDMLFDVVPLVLQVQQSVGLPQRERCLHAAALACLLNPRMKLDFESIPACLIVAVPRRGKEAFRSGAEVCCAACSHAALIPSP